MKHVEPSGTMLSHDAGAQCFRLRDERVALTPKAYALLVALTREPGRLLTKQELLAEVWPGVVVGEAVLKVAVNEVRRALDDDAQSPRFVATEHRRGYRFVGAVAGAVGRDLDRPALAGRSRALDFLRERLQRAQLGERQVVFVAGEAGIGKTALLDAFLASLPPGLAARVGRGECVETFGAHEPYAPFLEAFRRLAHGPLRAETIATLRRVAPRWLLELPFLASEGERAELARTLHGATRERMVREAGEAIDALAASGPLVLALEDLHWADASTLDLVAALARRGGAAKLLVVATWRPVEAILVGTPVRAVRDSLVAQKRAHDLLLDVLDPDGVAEHLRARFRGVEVTDAVARRVQRACHGHPLFMLHAVDWLAAERRLVARGGRLELDDDEASLRLDLPESLQQLLNREVERLAGDEVDVLEVASVAGFDFSAATVACGLEREVVPVEAVLERNVQRAQYLRSRGTIEWPNGVVSASYEFRHSLYRSFLYQRVPPARRVQLHRRIGDRGEEVFGARAVEIAAPLAVHFEEGRDPVRAVRYLELEARNDMRRCAPADAAAALSRALALLEAFPDAERGTGPIELLLARGSTRRVAGEMAEAAVDFSAAAERAARRGDAALEVRARLLVASALSWLDLPRCIDAVAAARRALRSIADADERTLVFGKLAYWDLLFDGNDRGGLEASEAALSLARSKGDRAAEAEHTVRHAFLLCAAGAVEEAARLARSGAALCQAVDNAFDPMVASFVEVLALRQTPDRARFDAVLDDARKHAEQNGHRAFALLFTLLSIWRDLDDGDAARARPALEQALRDARALAHGLSERLALSLAARLAGMQDDAPRRAALDAELASLSRERRVLLQWIADVARASPAAPEPPAARSAPPRPRKGAGRRHPQ
jgi:DNA-binding winged helix-turn-helix (wHTH) protein